MWSDCLPRSSHTPPVLVPPRQRESSPHRLPVSAPPTGLDECLFFVSLVSDFLVVRFSISSGCARRRSVSTYATILVLLLLLYFTMRIFSGMNKIFFERFHLFIFRQRGREGEREGEIHQCVVASRVPPAGDLAYNPGMYPNWESNWQPSGLQAGTQSTEPHQPELGMSKIL